MSGSVGLIPVSIVEVITVCVNDLLSLVTTLASWCLVLSWVTLGLVHQMSGSVGLILVSIVEVITVCVNDLLSLMTTLVSW